MARGWPEVNAVQPEHGRKLALVGSGPSVQTQYDELRNFEGDIWGINYAFHWMIPEGIHPKATVMADFRAEMADVINPVEGLTYYLASACSPKLLDKLAPFNPVLYHLMMDNIEEPFESMHVWGGTTTVTRAISLGHILGYREFHCFGMDSCQGPNNDWRKADYEGGLGLDEKHGVFKVVLENGQEFMTSAAHIMQVNDFINAIDLFDFNIIPHDGRLLTAAIEQYKRNCPSLS